MKFITDDGAEFFDYDEAMEYEEELEEKERQEKFANLIFLGFNNEEKKFSGCFDGIMFITTKNKQPFTKKEIDDLTDALEDDYINWDFSTRGNSITANIIYFNIEKNKFVFYDENTTNEAIKELFTFMATIIQDKKIQRPNLENLEKIANLKDLFSTIEWMFG